MVYDATDGLSELLAKESVTAYIGFDPTASSLHVGNLLTLMGLARLQRFGHSPIAIVGGGTGMIGDPSGKSLERVLLSADQITKTSPACSGSSSDFSISVPERMPRGWSTTPNGSRTLMCCRFCVIPGSISRSATCCRRNPSAGGSR